MTALILVDHDNHSYKPAVLNTVAAALACEQEVHALVAGYHAQAVAQSVAKIAGVSRVIHVDAPHFEHGLAENIAKQVLALSSHYDYFLAAATAVGKNVMPRVAAQLDVAQVSEIIRVVTTDTFERPIYAGNAIATVQVLDAKKVLTIRATSFEAVSPEGGAAVIDSVDPVGGDDRVQFKGVELTASDRPELTAAKVIVAGGRGLNSAEQFHAVLEPLADKLGAAIGASRAAVDAGFVSNDYQVGQTGKIVAPELYIALGISGAIQHLAGMKDSKVIVAINKDPEAPIFAVADYGLVADVFTAVPELMQAL